MRKRLATIAAIVLMADAASAQRAEVKAWRFDGATRRAIVYSPAKKSASGRAPLVLSFHGHGDNMQNFQHTDLHLAWPEAIVVYFQGLPSRRDGLDGWQTEKGQDDDRDLKLVDTALASLREQFKVDDTRIYSTGFSNGANFTYLLWSERPNRPRRRPPSLHCFPEPQMSQPERRAMRAERATGEPYRFLLHRYAYYSPLGGSR